MLTTWATFQVVLLAACLATCLGTLSRELCMVLYLVNWEGGLAMAGEVWRWRGGVSNGGGSLALSGGTYKQLIGHILSP